LTIDQAIATARAELGMPPQMDAIEERLSRNAAARVMTDFYREFEPRSTRFEVTFDENREAMIPKGVEITALYHVNQNISSHRVRPEDVPS
jgi:predicted component of type VI protein secretion system